MREEVCKDQSKKRAEEEEGRKYVSTFVRYGLPEYAFNAEVYGILSINYYFYYFIVG